MIRQAYENRRGQLAMFFNWRVTKSSPVENPDLLRSRFLRGLEPMFLSIVNLEVDLAL